MVTNGPVPERTTFCLPLCASRKKSWNVENKVNTFGPSGPVSGAARASGLLLCVQRNDPHTDDFTVFMSCKTLCSWRTSTGDILTSQRSTVTSKSRLHSSNLLALIIVRNKASNFNSYKQTLLLLLHNFITSSLRDISVLLSHCWAEVCTLQSAILASNVYLSTCAAPWVWALMQPAPHPQNQHQNSTLRIRRGQLCIGFEMTSHTGPHVDVLACASGV